MSDIAEKKLEAEEIPEPDEIMEPQPVEAQNLLWEYLDVTVDIPALEREEKFIGLEPEAQRYLASQTLAQQLGEIGTRFNFKPEEDGALAQTIYYLFIGEIAPDAFDSALAQALGKEMGAMGPIKDALKDVLSAFNAYAAKGVRKTAPLRQSSPPTIGVSEPITASPRPLPSTPQVEKPEPETPFMIHVERSDFAQLPKGVDALSPKPRFTEKESQAKQNEPKPVRVTIQTPKGEPSEKPKSRVVHYSNLRTPLPDDKI